MTKIPSLQTAQVEPFHHLEKILLEHQGQIETWFRQQWSLTPPPVYGSVDLRNAGFKIAPVDMNLYPAGFNNLSEESLPLAIQSVQALISQQYPTCQSILIIPENHSRNLFYWENMWTLQRILSNAGFFVRIGGDPEFFPEEKIIELSENKKIQIEPILHEGNRLKLYNHPCSSVEDSKNVQTMDDKELEHAHFTNNREIRYFDPCLIWLNNDLSSGIPDYLKGIEQPICPPMELGWHSRLKSTHFAHYRDVILHFSKLFHLDPWLLDPLFRYCGKVNFMERQGEDCLASNVEKLLSDIQKKYDEYDIKHAPFVIIKADAGTYGMSVMSVKSVDEIRHLNRKQRTNMAVSKGSQSVHRVIIQEGVYSFETWGENNTVAEPVIYMFGPYVVGGFYRLHKNKSTSESLNAPGMEFKPLHFMKSCNTPDKALSPDDCPNRFYAYGVIARLSMLAAAREQKNVRKL